MDPGRKVRNRRDFARGLARIEGIKIPNSWYLAPLFVVPFELNDPTSLDRLTIELIWALHNTMSCVEKGEEGAHIQGIAGLNCISKKDQGSTGGKPVIIPVYGQIAEDNESPEFYDNALKEMDIEIRIHEAKCADEEGSEKTEHYLFLIVKSPIAFSLRHAVYNTLQVKKRGNDGTYADERRMVWNKIATHVRQGLLGGANIANGRHGASVAYTEKEMSLAHDMISVNWFKMSSVDSFTCLFSIHQALDWVNVRFFTKYPQIAEMNLEGFGVIQKNSFYMTPSIISRYNEYDEDVDKAFANPKKNKKKRGRGNRDGETDDGASISSGANGEEEIVTIRKTELFISLQDGEVCNEFPKCSIAMHVAVTPYTESVVSIQQFMGLIRVFPASVTLDVLQKTLICDMRSVNGSSPTNRHVFEMVTEDSEDNLTLAESQQIVCGRNNTLDRSMLSNGDVSWARHCQNNVALLTGDNEPLRLDMLKTLLKLGYGLALTRAIGSDMYVNGRVASYSKFIGHNDGLTSKFECFELYKRLMNRSGDGTLDALGCFMDCTEACNSSTWHLKPDNLFMVIQMMVSDVMLALNYHESMIGGATNGIGANIIIRDGGGSYRRWFGDNSSGNLPQASNSSDSGLGQVYSKRNGSGADFGVSVYKSVVNIESHYPQFRIQEVLFHELKRTTEMGLLQETCNTIEMHGNGEKVQVHAVSETMKRSYSTELSAGNDQQSQSCMKAIAWLIPRNTTSLEVANFKTTREHEKTKTRIPVEYRLMIYGYWVICSNYVGSLSRERYKTLSTVSRNISSAAGALACSAGKSRDVPDISSIVVDLYNPVGITEARPVFLTGMCTAVMSAFMQWTGIIGKLPASPIVEAVISIFHFHLKFSKSLLNPDMYAEGERARYFQVSKARGAAKSLFITSLQETIESGRCCTGHQDAIERVCLRMITESTSPSLIPWVMADTMEHMFRMDFLILMQMFCSKFDVPSYGISMEELITWLESGNAEHCRPLHEWIQKQKTRFVRRSFANVLRRRGNEDLTDIAHCMYITHEPTLGCIIPDPSIDIESMVLSNAARSLFKQYMHVLIQQCQIEEKHGGEEIVKAMLSSCVNEQLEWPSMFQGSDGKLNNFWLDDVPPDECPGKQIYALAPVRIIITDARRAVLAVDCRWLLLISCLSGNSPSQSSRYTAIGHWIQYFYARCVPRSMTTGSFLYTGLPSPYMYGGFVVPKVPRYDNTDIFMSMLYRPNIDECMNHGMEIIGTNAPISTGMVEDLGPAAQRYQLANVLGISESKLPTHSVSYAFPYDIWLPVSIHVDGSDDGSIQYASLKIEEDLDNQTTIFYLYQNGQVEDITAPHITCEDLDEYETMQKESPFFLNGRVVKDIRPLCTFFRPSVLIETISPRDDVDTTVAGVITRYDHTSALYRAKVLDDYVDLTPYQVERSAKKVGTKLYLKLSGLPEDVWDPMDRNSIFFIEDIDDETGNLSQASMTSRRGGNKRIVKVKHSELDPQRDYIECKLSVPNTVRTLYDFYVGKIFVVITRKEVQRNRIDTFCSKATAGHESKIMCHKNFWIDVKDVSFNKPIVGHSFVYFSV